MMSVLAGLYEEDAKVGDCGSVLDVKEDLKRRKGLVTKMCLYDCSHIFSDPSKDSDPMNSKSILSSRLAGYGIGISGILSAMKLVHQ